MSERTPSMLAAMARRVLHRHGIAKDKSGPGASLNNDRASAFEAWFRDSKVVDASGAPLPVYHGTGADVTAFKHSSRGIFFTEDPEHASSYAALRSGPGNIVPAYLAIQHPYIQTEAVAPAVSQLKARGHDGIHRPRTGVWVAFHPEQIKSVYNTGTYDAADPDIRFARQVGATLLPSVQPPVHSGPAFDAWFKDSQVVDANGEPVPVYHGTASDVTAFHGPVTWVSAARDLAHAYATIKGADGGANLMPLHASIQRPLDLGPMGNHFTLKDLQEKVGFAFDIPASLAAYAPDHKLPVYSVVSTPEFISAARRAGYDGLFDFEGGRKTWGAFSPSALKSAIGNRGTYDATNPDIRFSRTHAAELPPSAPAHPFVFGMRHAAPMDATTLITRLAACEDAIDAEALAEEYAEAHERYLHGECHVLALALHARTQAPLWAAIETRGERAGCLIHAFVETDAGVIDLLGLRSRAAMLQEFDVWEPSFQPIDPEALAQLASAMPLRELAPELRAAQDVAAAVARIADTQRRLAANAAFDVWFHDSKAVTAEGRPLVAFHGTASNFTAFDPVAEGIDGIYFSSSPEIAAEYAHWRGTAEGGATIYPVHLAIRNPLEVTDLRTFEAHEFQMRIYDAQEAGHDGVVFRNVRDGWDSQTRADTWVAFQPTQIKSIFNAGTYAPGNPDIRFARDRTRTLPAQETRSAPSGRTDRDSACEP